MSGYYIQTEQELGDISFDAIQGTVFGDVRGRSLERIAREAGVKNIEVFFSMAPGDAAAFVEQESGEPPDWELEPEQWFEAKDGLASVRGMLRYLEQKPQAVTDVEQWMADLRKTETALEHLEKVGVRFHLSADY
jgi:hypothetical protein